jgi:orotidine-5'-phosphate decarboxylase
MTLIVALDHDLEKSRRIASSLCGVASGFKVGLPLLLEAGARAACSLRSLCQEGLWIADLKLADIGNTMKLTVSTLSGCVDAVIAHSVVGIEGALGELKEYLDRQGVKLILVVAMSHPGANEAYNRLLQVNIEIARKLNTWGVVAPATMPDTVRLVREQLPEVRIFSPGVGVQGARPGDALCAGADYEIVGRSITGARDPLKAAEAILAEQQGRLQRCRSGR